MIVRQLKGWTDIWRLRVKITEGEESQGGAQAVSPRVLRNWGRNEQAGTMGSVSGSRGDAAAALRHKGERCRSFVHNESGG